MTAEPTPADLVMETMTAYQRGQALKTAIELDLFTAIAEGARDAGELARRSGGAERGLRILCDALVVMGFLDKRDGRYELTEPSALHLDSRSPEYLGAAVAFVASPLLREGFDRLTEAVRKGGTAVDAGGTLAPDHPVWIDYARGMAARMAPTAESLAEMIQALRPVEGTILDIAAGHGLFGIAVARRNPGAELFALDWPRVLTVARERAREAGIGSRFHTIAGDAHSTGLGRGHDLILLANFLHHLGRDACVTMLRRVREALGDGGRAVALEYVVDEERVSPPRAGFFALVMLASTPAGDAYTAGEYREMFAEAGFSSCSVDNLRDSLQQVIVSEK
jgi:hypothetical protein